MKPTAVFPKMSGMAVPGLILLICVSGLSACKKTEYPNASFNFTGGGCMAVCKVTFTNTSTNATSYIWDFGDGQQPSLEENPKHTFFDPGIYEVSLTASNLEGSSTFTKSVTIANHPTKAKITGVTINRMPYVNNLGMQWDPQDGPDVRISITDSVNNVFWGPSATYQDVIPEDMPLHWDLPVPLEITDYFPGKFVRLYDVDLPFPSTYIGYAGFKVSNVASVNGPSTYTLQNGIILIVHLEYE